MEIEAKSRRLAEMIQSWAGEEDGNADLARYTLIEYLAKYHFDDYEPCLAPPQPFMARLWDWLTNVQDSATRRSLFALLDHLIYFNRNQFHTLYRTAFSSRIRPWLFDHTRQLVDAPGFEAAFDQVLARTWFCPVTDSMRINAFYHANRLSNVRYRPDWYSLAKFGDEQKLSAYLGPGGEYERLVLLEDFVGTGRQMRTAAEFAANLPSAPAVLLVPLLSLGDAAAVGEALALAFPRLSYAPVVVLDSTSQIRPTAAASDLPWQVSARELVEELHPRVKGERVSLMPFGYGDCGALASMYSNTPNNSLPLLHHDSLTWNALLPRTARV